MPEQPIARGELQTTLAEIRLAGRGKQASPGYTGGYDSTGIPLEAPDRPIRIKPHHASVMRGRQFEPVLNTTFELATFWCQTCPEDQYPHRTASQYKPCPVCVDRAKKGR